MSADSTFTLLATPPFSLEPVRKLACGFLRGSRSCGLNEVKLGFPLDGSFEVVGVKLGAEGDTVRVLAVGTKNEAVLRNQVKRILALDHDASGWQQVLSGDPVLKRISEATPGGFRPVVAYSPYVMAGWSVLSQRLRMTQAAAIQVRMAVEAGDVVTIEGEQVASFPRPQSILKLSSFPGVSDEKLSRLQAVAAAALDGRLEVSRLRALPYSEARAQLMEIRGIGPWTADAILMRGCGPMDALPLSEKTLHGAVALAYQLERLPTDAELKALSRRWTPFRMWASVMLIAHDFEGARARLAQNAQPRSRGQGRRSVHGRT
ncbi:MAG: DNA-3-methyladenine glycosylase 2 family protein [Myxococcota bacterium]